MADDGNDKIKFLLDLDVSEFSEAGLKAKGIIEKLGDAENLTGLLEGLAGVGVALAAVGVAAFAFKKAIDLTVEGEEIERVQRQFDTMATSAGVAPRKLQAGLEQAAKGLVDTDDLLKIANASIVKMGGSADKLPQLMEIARKSVEVYGGDAKSNFQAITEAVANGNTRLLKHYGIIIDATKAERDFATANGVTADSLSDAGKKQAILNAALDSGNKAFKGVGDNASSATQILQRLKVIVAEIGQTFTIAFERIAGPTVRSFLGIIEKGAEKLGLITKVLLGDSKQAGEAYTQLMGKQIGAMEKIEDAATQKSIANAAKASQASIVDSQKVKANKLKFQKDLEKLDADYFKAQQNNVKSMAQVEKLAAQQGLMLKKQHTLAMQQIDANASLTAGQKRKLKALEEKKYNEQSQVDEENLNVLRGKLLDNYAKHSTSVFDGIAKSFAANTAKMKLQQQDFGKQGAETWNSLQSNASSAFQSMGAAMAQGKDIGQATVDALKGMFLGMLGDRAIAAGSVMLGESIWPPNPVGLAGGAGLLALGGALKSLAGPSASGSTMPSSPSTSAVASGATPTYADTSASSNSDSSAVNMSSLSSQTATPQRTVSVNIAGNYLETDQTKRMLMDLMRQESDATGFAYNQIGAGA